MKKKVLSLVCMAVLAFGLVGCGSKGASTDTKTEAPEVTPASVATDSSVADDASGEWSPAPPPSPDKYKPCRNT